MSLLQSCFEVSLVAKLLHYDATMRRRHDRQERSILSMGVSCVVGDLVVVAEAFIVMHPIFYLNPRKL